MFDYVGMGVFFRILRKERHLTIEIAAEMINITPKALGNIELGKSKPKIETALLLCDIYGIPGGEIAYFYQRTEDIDYILNILHHSLPLCYRHNNPLQINNTGEMKEELTHELSISANP